jgi:NitT/TauT family transport system substrate-binding protein
MRRIDFARGVALAALGTRPGPASAQAANKLVVGINASNDVTPILWAHDTGMFSRAGLDIEIQKFASGTMIAAAVIGGSVDVGRASLLPLIEARARGIPVQLIVADTLALPIDQDEAIVVAKNSPIGTGKDLNGATLPVPAINDINTIETRAWIDATGGDSKTVHFIELPISSIVPAIVEGRIPAGMVENPHLAKGLADGTIKIIGRANSALAKRYLITAYFTTESFISQHRDAIVAFAQVMQRSNAFVNDHHAEAMGRVASFWGINASVIENEPRPTTAAFLDPADIQPVIDGALRYGVITKPPDATSMIAPMNRSK